MSAQIRLNAMLFTSFMRTYIGYARVSTQDQNFDFQKQALKQAGCKKIFEDQISGSQSDRPGLARVLETLRAGDTLVVWKLDRLGRSVKHLVDLVAQLQEQDVQFKSLTDSIDTSTTSGRFFFFHVMASLAQMERELTLERTYAGLAAARQRGKVGGRKRQMTDSRELHGTGRCWCGRFREDHASALVKIASEMLRHHRHVLAYQAKYREDEVLGYE